MALVMRGAGVVGVEVTGLEGLLFSLQALPRKVQGKILRTAMRNGTKTVAAKTRELAPVDTGLLKRSFAVRALKRKKGRVGYRITIKNVDKIIKTGEHGQRYFYPAAIEYGTHTRPAKPFMRPAFEQTVEHATDQIANELGEAITAAAKVPPGGGAGAKSAAA